MLMPPMTTAAMAYISLLLPMVAGSTEPFMASHMKVLTPQRRPVIVYTATCVHSTLMPARRAARSLLPMA